MINFRLLFVVMSACAILAWSGFTRLEIATDVLRALPEEQKVLADARAIFQHHPFHDQIAVDVALADDNPQLLLACGKVLENTMRDSGLFAQVGTGAMGELIPELAGHAADHLPLLFSRQELDEMVAARLTVDWIDERLRMLRDELSSITGIGQSAFIGNDPLGLKDLVLARLAPLVPTHNARLQGGQLVSADGRHLLIIARPLHQGTDTAAARQLDDFFSLTTRELTARFSHKGKQLAITPMGAFRAALDNERIIRHDVRLALGLSTAGIALLLLLSFPRPLIGLLCLLPALAGTACALFVYSLLQPSISIMTLGFGGAILSITVDYGIAYLLFLDQPHHTNGKTASHEVGALSYLTMLTSAGSFLLLGLSGFPIYKELGQFTALGLFFTYLFVHLVFPRVFPVMSPGNRRALPLRRLVDWIYSGGKKGAVAALLLAVVLLLFARPQFQVTLDSMNTVSSATRAAETLFSSIWGDLGARIFLMHRAASLEELQRNDDLLLEMIEQDIGNRTLQNAFVPSMLFPGRERARRNLNDWRAFWDETRAGSVREILRETGIKYGFTPNAFAPFLERIDPRISPDTPPIIPERFFALLGISPAHDSSGALLRFVTVIPGPHYECDSFFSRYGGGESIFDPAHFSRWLANFLFSSFAWMLLVIGVCMACILLLTHLNLILTLLTLTPPTFALVCTLGTMRLLGHPLDIPALMLSVVILGMGIDYGILCVRAHQRYREISHPSYALARNSAFLAAASTLIGFGVLCGAEHSLLRSIGITSLLGIGYSLMGAFLLLPPLLQAYFSRHGADACTAAPTTNISQRVRCRYRTLEPYPRLFARMKMHYDPLFRDLSRILSVRKQYATMLDIGCGYGVPACWCLETFPALRIAALEPDPERVRVARLAMGTRGHVIRELAPHLPQPPQSWETTEVDGVLVLDMLHYLDDETAADLLQNCFQTMVPGGVLIARFALPPGLRPSWSWRLEHFRIQRKGMTAHYREREHMTALFRQAGLRVILDEVSPGNAELAWMVGQVPCKD